MPQPYFSLEVMLSFAYGISVALFTASILYMWVFALFHTFSHQGVWRIEVSNKHIVKIFMLAGLSYLFFGLFNIYALQIHNDFVTKLISPTALSALKLSAPIALVCFTYMFTMAVPIKSLQAFVFWDKQKKIYDLLYVIDAVFIVALLLFIHDPKMVVIASLLLFVPHCLVGGVFAYKGLAGVRLNLFYAALFVITASLMTALALMVVNDAHLTYAHTILPIVHVVLGLIVLLLSSVVLHYNQEESGRFMDIKKVKIVNFFSQIYSALNKNEFYLQYQPKLDLATDTPCGLEALIRWHHPINGEVTPDNFIPAAEQTDVINNICQWTIMQVVKDMSTMRDQGFTLPISINFSPKNLYPEMVMFLKSQILKANLSPKFFVIEITETSFVNQTQAQVDAIRLIREAGFMISLDDYGTGYSSLGSLDSIGVSEIKIDKRFVLNIDTSKKNSIIVHSTIEMGKALDIFVVAEGVENTKVQNILKGMRCDCAQGFGIARPMNLADTVDWLSKRQAQMV